MSVPTMSSLELLDLVNAARIDAGEAAVRRNDFHARVRHELEDEHYETFVVTNGNGTQTDAMRLSRDQCMYVLMRESKVVRRVVTARLNDVTVLTHQVPTTLSGALRLAAEQAEQIERQTAQIEAQKPAVEFVDRYGDAGGSKSFREVCKLLAAKENEFRAFLHGSGIVYRLNGRLMPYQHHLNAGRFEIRAGVTQDENAYAFNQTRFTPKGVEWIAGKWMARQLAERDARCVEA
ncbi:phage antirepressor KilAC domain-containing protein [Caballeronia sp. LZ001]|uniref:phage antirepressor KilAC domain-containing protein n=1 Tax=Caballeronia sp. LZ001 TaxID=3038553 RepID=UPI002860B166|nr:phage antirepressor KilAC domain-containing protein [Caballeronia sp. LZ001]MDR5800596.1 phage antirepressor KilAC domain-containing protein [Caballeronia sp. LZ001]